MQKGIKLLLQDGAIGDKKTTFFNLNKLQNYSPRLGTVIFEAFSLRKRNSMRYTTRQQFQEEKRKKIFNIVLMMTKLDNDNNSG